MASARGTGLDGGVQTFSLAERPDLLDAFWSIPGDWPTFMLQDPISDRAYEAAVEGFPQLHLVVMDGDVAVARLHAVPLAASIDSLPPRGWDWALQRAEWLVAKGGPPDLSTVSLIEARVAPDRRGEGLSGPLLVEARRRYAELGCRDLFGPVRPTRKALEPRSGADEYARRVRDDGLPQDPWLRVHARLGGKVVEVAPLSMTIPGTLAQWREWTGLPFDVEGAVEVPGALAPVHVDIANDHAVYVEPNVWVHHDLRASAS
ncbi:N-acetyltransferase [Janibacter limosus]|uniref:N-acetyltransferase n=1 Tax=Janibacter limosus TaxID=53458 RepID=A0A4V0ZBF3_9MICO|nr:N-acetyltransferase [Janibacter limosus]